MLKKKKTTAQHDTTCLCNVSPLCFKIVKLPMAQIFVEPFSIEFSRYIIKVLLHSNISQTISGPTLATSAGAIVLLICSTAFETPARDKQTMTNPDRRSPCRAGETDDHRAPHLILLCMRTCECF